MNNHKSRPIGYESFLKVNAISTHNRGRGHGHDRGRNFQYHVYDNNPLIHKKGKHHFIVKSKKGMRKKNEENIQSKFSKTLEKTYYRYETKGHWARTFRTAKHLVDMYQASLKE